MIKAQLFDTVELLIDIPQHALRAGMQGAVVEKYDEEHFEVEFINKAGETEQTCVLTPEQFIVVWQNATKQWVPITEQMAQLVERLDEMKQREILDFGRFLRIRQEQTQLA